MRIRESTYFIKMRVCREIDWKEGWNALKFGFTRGRDLTIIDDDIEAQFTNDLGAVNNRL